MQKEEIIEEINNLIIEGNDLIKTKWYNGANLCVAKARYENWHSNIKMLLSSVLPKNNQFLCDIIKYKFNYASNVEAVILNLKSVIRYSEKGVLKLDNIIDSSSDVYHDSNQNKLDTIFNNFNKCAIQLKYRHDHRETLIINDEYDVQDLLHSLLLLFYDDVRVEEWTPSFAGKSSRQDFLIKKEKIVIEAKMTRNGLTDKELGDQLIIDVERYRNHPDCNQLYFFIYDPTNRVKNSAGFITDLEERYNGFIKVYINPRS